MEMRQLRYFAAIAEEGQITRAARKLHMAQPPLSQQLKALEEELGTVLFERGGRNMELTPAGKVLYSGAKEILQRSEELRQEVSDVGDGLEGTLHLGSVKTCFSCLPEKLLAFRKQHPQVRFRLFEGDSYRLADHLKKREIELAVVRMPLDMGDFSFIPLPADRFVLATSDVKLKNSVTINELTAIPLMLLHRLKGVGLYELVLNHFSQHNVVPNVICECPDAAMLLSLVRAGMGSALLPASTLNSFSLEGVRTLEIKDAAIESEAALIWLKDRYLSKMAQRFIDLFDRHDLSENEFAPQEAGEA